MKKKLYQLAGLFCLVALALAFAACPQPEDSTPDTTFTVDFSKNTTEAVTGIPGQITGVRKGAKITAPTQIPERDGYTFTGWFKETACTNAWVFETDTVTKDTTLFAKWSKDAETFTVTYLKNTTDEVEDLPAPVSGLTSGSTITQPSPNPDRDDYNFIGWYKDTAGINAWNFDTDTVTADTDLYAKWVQKVFFTVTFDANGATAGSAPDPVEVESGTDITLPPAGELEKTPWYSFGGWNTKASGTGTNYLADSSYEVTATVTLYADWVDDGTGTISISLVANNDFPDVTGGVAADQRGMWKDVSDPVVKIMQDHKVTSSTRMQHNMTLTNTGNRPTGPLTVKYDGAAEGSYQLSDAFETNNDTRDMINGVVLSDDQVNIRGCINLKEVGLDVGESVNLQFRIRNGGTPNPQNTPGTYTQGFSITGRSGISTAVTLEITVGYEVVFAPNNIGVTNMPATLTGLQPGDKVPDPLSDPECENFTFEGWFKDSAMTTPWDFDEDEVNANISIYAKWTSLLAPPDAVIKVYLSSDTEFANPLTEIILPTVPRDTYTTNATAVTLRVRNEGTEHSGALTFPPNNWDTVVLASGNASWQYDSAGNTTVHGNGTTTFGLEDGLDAGAVSSGFVVRFSQPSTRPPEGTYTSTYTITGNGINVSLPMSITLTPAEPIE